VIRVPASKHTATRGQPIVKRKQNQMKRKIKITHLGNSSEGNINASEENEDPEIEDPKTRKRRPLKTKTKSPEHENEDP